MRKFIYKSGRTQSAQGREPALDYPIAEGRERVKGGEAACEALDVNSVFCYQPACLPASQCASCSCTFFRPIGFRRHDAVWRIPASKPNGHQEKCYHTRPAPDLAIQTLNDVVGTDFLPVLGGKSIYVSVSSMATFSYSPPQFRFR